MRAVGVSVLCLVLLVSLSGCGPAQKTLRPDAEQLTTIQSLAVVVESDSQFEVIHSRATADAAGAALFGLVGAAIGSSIDKGEDEKRAEQVASAVEDLSCKSLFSKGLSRLQENKRFQSVRIFTEGWNPDQAADYDAVVMFTIEKWGLRLIDQESNMVSGFLELDMKMQAGPDMKTIWDERHVLTGQGRKHFREYSANPELVKQEMSETLQQAGINMANLIIYY